MDFTLILFYILAVTAVVTALGLLLSRNAVYAALFLVLNFGCVAVFYLLLGAPFIAMAQITVYAGAIMVLFLFVIMLLNLGHASSDMRGPSSVAAAIVIVGLLVIELTALWRYTPRRLASEIRTTPVDASARAPGSLSPTWPLAPRPSRARSRPRAAISS